MRWNEEVNVPAKNVKLHKVVLLDCSGSMAGNKYNAAEQGVKLDYDECKEEFVDYLLSEFSDYHNETTYNFTSPLKFSPQFGNTMLYKTIVDVLTKVKKKTPKEDKVLVQIFTDGQDNISKGYLNPAKDIINQFNSLGWTVTFVGTERDVEYIQSNLNIDSTNTLVHDNTASGVADSFDTYRSATRSFTKNVAEGKETTRGFFKTTTNE